MAEKGYISFSYPHTNCPDPNILINVMNSPAINKKEFVDELFRVTKPGDHVIIITWCRHDLREGSKLKAKEIRLLQRN